MYFSFILCNLFVAVCFLVVLFLIKDTIKPIKYPPGPSWLPFLGSYLTFQKLLKKLGYYHLVWERLSSEYGPVVGLKLGTDRIVVVSGKEAVKEVLTREDFDGRPDGFFFRLRTFGKKLGIVFVDGKFWQEQRKFSLKHLRSFGFGRQDMGEQIANEAAELVEVLKKKCSGNTPVLMHNIFDISVLNVLWAMIAGERFTLDDSRLEQLIQIVHEAFRLLDMSGGLLNQMPFLRYFAPEMSGYNKLMLVLEQMWEFLETTINEHEKTFCASTARDLIDAFLQQMSVDNKSGSTFTREQLISICLDLFMAGSETTSNTLGFVIMYMVLYPDVQEKVQHELDTVVGRDRMPSIQDRTELRYTDAVLSEIQRLCNVAPMAVAHRAMQDATLFGYKIPQDTTILVSLRSLHVDPERWGSDCLTFRPERFLEEKAIDQDWFAPFGFGRRRCLGEALAKTSLFLFFTAVVHNFSLKVSPNYPKPDVNGYDGVTISPKPFYAVLTPRY